MDMKYFTLIILVVVVGLGACTRDDRHARLLADVERMAGAAPDSALAMLEGIDVEDLGEDSLRAQYYMATATAHKANEASMVSDSMIRFAYDYYRGRDFDRFVRSGNLYALHRFWMGDGSGALALLDSLAALPDVPDRVMIELLATRIGVGGAEFDCERNIGYIKRLQALDTDSANRTEYEYQLCENYQFAGHSESALAVIDELIAYAGANRLGEEHFTYTYEKIGILEELGRYEESNALVDYIMEHAPHNSAVPYLRFWKALNYFNMGDYTRSARELALADSTAAAEKYVDNNYYGSFAEPLRGFLEYRKGNVVRLSQLATINNAQRDRFSRMESIRRETEQDALRQENRALVLKAQNERKTAVVIIVALAAILAVGAAVWQMQKRKRLAIEAEERAEALQKMVDELRAPAAPSADREALRRAMLQQLGIIKMVAESPTEQNREMLRRISSIGSDTGSSLVNWANVYDIIDNLYSGFYSRLHDKYGHVLIAKEEQIIVLMMAGFSTKEISVITAQTTATVYVRKSSVRKKLGVPGKEDIVAFLGQTTRV